MEKKKMIVNRARFAQRILASLLLIVLMTTIMPTSAFAKAPSYQYKVVAVRSLGKVLNTTPFASVQGDPGVTISITRNQAVSRTYSCTAKVTIKEINAAIGWSKSQTDQVSVSNGGSWKVPTKANGKKVAKGTLLGYVYMDAYEYKIMRRTVTVSSAGRGGTNVKYGKWEDWKTGCVACKARANDVCFKKSYTYKK